MPNSSLRPTDMKSTVSSNDFQTGNTFKRILSLIFFELFGVQRKTAKTPFLASNALKSKNAFNSAVLFCWFSTKTQAVCTGFSIYTHVDTIF